MTDNVSREDAELADALKLADDLYEQCKFWPETSRDGVMALIRLRNCYHDKLRPIIANTLERKPDDVEAALREMVASCTSTTPNVHDDCGTCIVTAPSWEALKKATDVLAAIGRDEKENSDQDTK